MIENSLFNSDSFSFNRVGAMFAYYFPTLRKQFIVYLGISLFFAGLLLIPGSDNMRTGFYSLTWTILYWMWFLAPLSMVGRGRSGTIDRLLPVKASEKLVFLLLWFMVVIPIVIIVPPQSAEYLVYTSLGDANPHFKEAIYFQLHCSWIMKLINIFSNICACIGCLYAVLKSRHNKMLFGILTAIGIQIVLGILGAIYGGYEVASKAFKKGFEDGIAGKTCDLDPLQFAIDILHPSPFTYAVLGIIIAAIITFVALIYRRLRKPSL